MNTINYYRKKNICFSLAAVRFLLFTAVFLAQSFCSGAQNLKEINYYRHLSFEDGLPENDIKEFYSDDQNGYWFRTRSNVVFFNGYDYLVYSNHDSLFRVTNQIIEECSYYNNHLYVFGNRGIDKINCKTKLSENIFKDTIGLHIKGGYVTKKGIILLISESGSIIEFRDNKLRTIGAITYYTDHTICETNEGDIIVTNGGDVIITNGNKEVVVFSADLKFIKRFRFSGSSIIHGGVYMFSKTGPVIVAEKETFSYNSKKQIFENTRLNVLLRRLFLSTDNFYYYVEDFKTIIQQNQIDETKRQLKINLNLNYYVNAINNDRNGNIVLCTNQGVILYKEPQMAFNTLPLSLQETAMSPTVRRALVETKEGKILQVNYWSVNLYDPVKQTNRRLSSKNLVGYSGCIIGNDLWIGTDGAGLVKMDINTGQTKSLAFLKEVGKGKTMHVTAIHQLSDTLLLLGTSLRTSTLKTYHIRNDKYADVILNGWSDNFLQNKVTAIVGGTASTAWICTVEGLLQINSRFELLKYIGKSQLGTDVVNFIYQINQQLCWIATDEGLFFYDLLKNKVIKHFNVENGLSGNKCLAVLQDNYGTLWIPTFNGLSRIDQSTQHIRNYFMQDGLPDNEYNFSSFLKSRNGDIYLGGLNGYLRIKPFPFQKTSETDIYAGLDYVLLRNRNGVKLIDSQEYNELRLHSEDDHLSVVYSVKNQLYAERVRYEYMIDGLHKEWILLNRQNQIEIDYLPVGNYRLRIRGLLANETLPLGEVELALKIYDYWYESKYFYLFVAALIISLVTIGLNYRYQSLQKLGRIKTELANDIHDEIGTILTKAIMKTELLKRKVGSTYPEISGIENNLRDAVFSFRNILWSLNTENRKAEDFIGRLNLILEQTFEHTYFQYIVTNHSPNVYFNKSVKVKRNMLLVVQELAHNALKHSKGNLFEVIISSEGNKWHFLIVDNGVNQHVSADNGGIGIKSIRERIQSMRGEMHFQQRDIGFYVSIKI